MDIMYHAEYFLSPYPLAPIIGYDSYQWWDVPGGIPLPLTMEVVGDFRTEKVWYDHAFLND